MNTLLRSALFLLFFGACGDSEPTTEPPPGETTGEEIPPPEETPPEETPAGERPTMTGEECESQGGTVVGDIGDGAVHRPDYVCPNGSPPIGTVPVGIEGSVCCAAE
jgi:hypothetical protein